MTRFPKLVRWIIWGALLQALVVYFIVTQVTNPEERDSTGGDSLRTIFYAVGFVLFLVGQAIGYIVNHLRTSEGERRVPAWIDPAFIGSLALTEAIGIFGLILALGGVALIQFLPLFVLSLVGMLLLRPSAFYRVANSLAP